MTLHHFSKNLYGTHKLTYVFVVRVCLSDDITITPNKYLFSSIAGMREDWGENDVRKTEPLLKERNKKMYLSKEYKNKSYI